MPENKLLNLINSAAGAKTEEVTPIDFNTKSLSPIEIKDSLGKMAPLGKEITQKKTGLDNFEQQATATRYRAVPIGERDNKGTVNFDEQEQNNREKYIKDITYARLKNNMPRGYTMADFEPNMDYYVNETKNLIDKTKQAILKDVDPAVLFKTISRDPSLSQDINLSRLQDIDGSSDMLGIQRVGGRGNLTQSLAKAGMTGAAFMPFGPVASAIGATYSFAKDAVTTGFTEDESFNKENPVYEYNPKTGRRQFTKKFIDDAAADWVLTGQKVPFADLVKSKLTNRFEQYKYGLTTGQQNFDKALKILDKIPLKLGAAAEFPLGVAQGAFKAFEDIDIYAQNLIKGRSEGKAASEVMSKQSNYNFPSNPSFSFQVGTSIGEQIPSGMLTIATSGMGLGFGAELAAIEETLGAAAMNVELRAGINAGLRNAMATTTGRVAAGLAAGVKGIQKIGIGNVMDNGLSMIPGFYPIVHSHYYEDLYKKGFRGDELERKANERATISLLSEMIYNPFHSIGALSGQSMINALLSASKVTWGSTLGNLAKATAKSFLPEAFEETVNKVADDWQDFLDAKQLSDNPELTFGRSLMSTKEGESYKFKNILSSVANSGNEFILGGVAGLLMGGRGEFRNLQGTPLQSKALDMALADIDGFNKTIDNYIGKNKVTPAEGEKLKAFVNTLAPYHQEAKGKDLKGIPAAQWALYSAKLNEAANKMLDPTITPSQKQSLVNTISQSKKALSSLENGMYIGSTIMDNNDVEQLASSQSPYGVLTNEQAYRIGINGAYKTEVADLNDNPMVTDEIRNLAEQMRNGEIAFEDQHGAPVILDAQGNVIDGKKRVAKALADGVTKINTLTPVTEQESEAAVLDAINNGIDERFNEVTLEGLSEDDKTKVKNVVEEFKQRKLKEQQRLQQGEKRADVEGSEFELTPEVEEGVEMQQRNVVWAISQLNSLGINNDKAAEIVASMLGNNISKAEVKAYMSNIAGPLSEMLKQTEETPTEQSISEPVPNLSVADQIASLKEKMSSGELSKAERAETRQQINDLANSEEVSTFTRIINEATNLITRSDKNCP
jgi:hypothetical protein